MSRPNTTQRSWDNYVGDNPIESRKKKGFYSESQRHSLDGDDDYVPEGYERDPITGKLKKKKSVKEILDDKPKKGESSWEKLQRESALKRGMDEVKKSKRVEGDEDEDIYTA
jgi:hypothetical protein